MTSSNINLSKLPVLQGQQNYANWAVEVESTAMLGSFWPVFIRMNTATTNTDSAKLNKITQRECTGCHRHSRLTRLLLDSFFILLSPTLHIHSLILSFLLSYLFMWHSSYLTHHFTFIILHSLSFFEMRWFISMMSSGQGEQLITCRKEDGLHRPT